MHIDSSSEQAPVLASAAGPVALEEYCLRTAGRSWGILHAGTMLTVEDENDIIAGARAHLPFGVVLWPAAIALAHEVASYAGALNGQRVLELGCGTGLPGIVAASFGAHVVQTDRDATALDLCRRNGARNGITTIAYQAASWTAWRDTTCYDWILGADILYDDAMHPFLRLIFETQLTPHGRILLTDPYRDGSHWLLETLARNGWTVAQRSTRSTDDGASGAVGVYEVTRSGT